MKTSDFLSRNCAATVVSVAAVLVLATGCVQERVVHVVPAHPVVVQAPGPPSPPPVVVSPPQIVEVPAVPPPAPTAPMRSAADLDKMLAPIALYPDPLLAQILPAATMPEQIVLTDRYVREGADINQVDAQAWDPSLKALARYPGVLKMLDENLAWTTDLGQAFLNQPADVMDSVQRLRAQARAVGNLQSTPQQTVLVSDGMIEIVPPTPQVIYVPVYQPEVVYIQPPSAPGRFHISFGAGLVVGAWLNHDCDWHRHEVIVWHHDHPRPADWWYQPPTHREPPTIINNVTVVKNTTIVNQNFTVWHPRPRSAVADRGDRGWNQPVVRATTVAQARNLDARPAATEARQPTVTAEAQKSAPPREVRPTAPVSETHPNQPAVQRTPARPQEARANPPRQEVKTAPTEPSGESRAAAPRQEVQPAASPARAPSRVRLPAGNAPAPVTSSPSNSQRPSGRQVTVGERSNRPIPAPKDAHPAPASATAKQPSAAPASPPVALPSATPRPAVNAAVRTPSAALTGIESARATREASARGQQSREAIAKPTTTSRPQSAGVPAPKGNAAETKRPQQSRAK